MVSSVVSDEKVMNYINGEWVGSESEEYTDIINPANGDILGKVLLSTENDVQKAVNAAKAAGAKFCGVDMMIDDIEREATVTNYCIIEINFNPAIHIHCYPYQGENRKADEKILDLLFGKLV